MHLRKIPIINFFIIYNVSKNKGSACFEGCRILRQLNINDIMVHHWYPLSSFFYDAQYHLRGKSNGLEDFYHHLRNDFSC